MKARDPNNSIDNYSTCHSLSYAAEAIREHLTSGTIDSVLAHLALDAFSPFECLVRDVEEANTNGERYSRFEFGSYMFGQLDVARKAIQKALRSAVEPSRPPRPEPLPLSRRWLVAGR